VGKPKPKENPINNIVVVSDLHCGSTVGLCPPHKIERPEGGGGYTIGRGQKDLWKRWRYFWDVFVPSATRGEQFTVVVNGDVLDGDHHDTTFIISRDLTVQRKIAKEILEPILDACRGRLYFVAGTEAHTGKSGTEERGLAEELKARRDKWGNILPGELWLKCGPWLGQFAHHIGVTSSQAYDTSAVRRELNDIYAECAASAERPPDFLVRSHRHRRVEVRIPSRHPEQDAIAFVTPGWQLKTPFSYRTAGGRNTQPQLGGVVIRHHDGVLFTRASTWNVKRPPTVTTYYREGE